MSLDSMTRTGPRRAVPGLAALGGLAAGLGTMSCCVLPFVLVTLGLGGSWLGNLTALSPYQPLFFGAGIGAIGTGFWLLRRRASGPCAPGEVCARAGGDRLTRIGLWSAVLLLAVGVAFPRLAGVVLGS